MLRFAFVPIGDSRLAHLVRRNILAAAASAMVVALLFAAYLTDVLSVRAFLNAALLTLTFVVAFYVVFRSGFNLRFSDPSLTIPQMLASTAVIVYVLYEAKDSHGILSIICLVSFMFGVFRLSTRQLLAIAAFTAISYALVIGLQWHADPNAYLLKRKVLTWIVLTTVLVYFSLMGGFVSKLRKELADSNKRAEAAVLKIEELAARDELTGVHNRRWLIDNLNLQKNRADRYGTTFSVLMLDIDHFKRVNDTYGHDVGDQVLRMLADSLDRSLRNTDVFGRYGGEEFLAILDQTALEGAPVAAARMCALTRQLRFDDPANELRISVSVGCAQYRKLEDWQKTVNRADEALYRAKQGGRDRFEMESVHESNRYADGALLRTPGIA